eukprot:1813087-Amphidinium_carterae.1
MRSRGPSVKNLSHPPDAGALGFGGAVCAADSGVASHRYGTAFTDYRHLWVKSRGRARGIQGSKN